MGFGTQQAALVVLAMDLDQGAPELAQQADARPPRR